MAERHNFESNYEVKMKWQFVPRWKTEIDPLMYAEIVRIRGKYHWRIFQDIVDCGPFAVKTDRIVHLGKDDSLEEAKESIERYSKSVR